MPKTKTTKKHNRAKPLCKCAMRHWDCFACNENGYCTLLNDMEVVNKRHHCGFFKKRNLVQ